MHRYKTNYIALVFLVLTTGLVAVFAQRLTLPTPLLLSETTAGSVEIGKVRLTIPDWQLFDKGAIWGLVRAGRQLPSTFTPSLIESPVAHTTGDARVSANIAAPLASLARAAEADGIHLMLSSAYRSYDDQQAIVSAYLRMRGQQYVQSYVAAPGASEHQTGLAVDLATVTHGCSIDPNGCSLDAPSIAWLRAHAADYGFIERYPEGKQFMTGIAGEHWHYRYVGVPLAKALSAANMTLDEFVQQVAPGM